jgi:hypothetical protein
MRTMSKSRLINRLSLSQRERIKVSDCSVNVLPAPAKSREERRRVFPEPDDSRSERQKFLVWRGILRVFDHASVHYHSYVPRHPVRSRASQPGNKSRVCKDRGDVVAETYSLRSSGCADVAKECAHSSWPFCEVSERGSQRKNNEWFKAQPLTSVLSPPAGERRTAP